MRIERLSDDEDVDITDDSSNDGLQVENQSDCDEKEEICPMSPQTDDLLNSLTQSQTSPSEGVTDPDTNEIAGLSQNRIDLEPDEESVNNLLMSCSPGKDSLLEEESSDGLGMFSYNDCDYREIIARVIQSFIIKILFLPR